MVSGVKIVKAAVGGVICSAWIVAYIIVLMYTIQCFVEHTWICLVGMIMVIIGMNMLAVLVAQEIMETRGWV